MAESKFGNIGSVTASSPSPSPLGHQGEETLRLLNLPEKIENIKQKVRIQGDVIRKEADGTLIVRTKHGDITAKAAKGSNIREGQRVEIEIIPYRSQPKQDSQQQQIVRDNLPKAIARPISSSAADIDIKAQETVNNSAVNRSSPKIDTQSSARINIPIDDLNILQGEENIKISQVANSLKEGQIVRLTEIKGENLQNLLKFISGNISENISVIPDFSKLNFALPKLNKIASSDSFIQLIKSVMKVDLAIFSTVRNFNIVNADNLMKAPVIKNTPKLITEEGSIVINKSFLQDFNFSTNSKISSMIDAKIVDIKSQNILLSLGKNIISPNIQKAGYIQAVVIGTSQKGFPIVSTAPFSNDIFSKDQIFMISRQAGNLPAGTIVTLAPKSNISLNIPSSSPLPNVNIMSNINDILASGKWISIDELSNYIMNMPDSSLIKAFSNIIPSPSRPANIPSSIMFFIAAIKSGDITAWLGEKMISTLRKDARGSNILSRIISEASNVSRLSADTISSDWRVIPIPLMWQNEIEKIHLFYKKDEKHDEKEENKNGEARFILELDLSNMGDVQIDTLIRGKKMDMAVRTEIMFSSAMKQKMRNVYNNALEVSGMNGELHFQHNKDAWVKINAEKKQHIGVEI